MYKSKWIYLLARVIFVIVAMVSLILLVKSCPAPCKHEETYESYSFVSQDGHIEYDYIGTIKKYCKKCHNYLGITFLREQPTDLTYLNLICEHSDSDELVDGEYYTMSATVSINYDYGYGITCSVKNDDITVEFSVKFREEFKDEIELIEDGNEIVFRGKFDIASCDWSDCELIDKNEKA